MFKWWCNLAGCLLTAGLLLTACASEQPADPVSSLQTQHDEGMAEEGQTLTIVNPEPSPSPNTTSPAEAETGEYQIQTRLTDFKLMSDTAGLAWGSTRSELRLYTTRDNGKTWTNISPSSSIQFPNNPQYGKDLFFKDLDHGWVVRDSLGSGEAIVLRTTNGGGTWKMTSLPKADDVSSIYFVNEQRGWILTVGDGADSIEAKAVYTTANGGATWEKIMSTPLLPTDTSAANHTLPKLGKPDGMMFTDQKNGYATLIEDGAPTLYVTVDGGHRWTKSASFFDESKITGCTRFTTTAPQGLNASGTAAWVAVGCGGEGALKYNGYFTQDAGKHWSLALLGLPWQREEDGGLSTTFLNSQEGWTLQKSVIMHTVDQGKTWSPLPESRKLREVLADYPEVVKLQFHSQKTGWLLVANHDKKRSLLMQTQDGGVSWHVL
ncbi:WD40/YVTN/BNR-like repeat-containing protein [Paenibacillus sp. A14]|uniref:WD40/YVTN/BNR-like repeat-containing protein n=1 Tax=Paenibacillus sp. A14 TaxID=3119820 RepID=UPI002FE2A312